MKNFSKPTTIEGMIAFFGTGYFSPQKPKDIQGIVKSPVQVIIKPKSADEILFFVRSTESIPPITNDHWTREYK